MSVLSRRSFLGGATLGAAALAGSPIAAFASTKVPAKWDETTSFLIIGTGFAGLAAALEAHGLGMKANEIMVVDKMPTAGGNSIINGGAVAAAGTDMQKAEGIKDNPDLLFADIVKAGGGLAHPSLARRIADESVENFYWLRDKIGVKFKAVTFHGGHSVKRSHAVTNNSGSGFINPMLAKLKEYGIEPRLRTIVDEIIVDENNCVLGVKARVNYRYGREKSGKVTYIRATKGVLLASGGFSNNVKMRMSHDPRLNEKFDSTNHPGATGEMIQEAQMIGANTIQMDWIQMGPWTSPDEKGFGLAPLFVESALGYGPMIDPVTAKRFIQESGNRKVRADAIMVYLNKGGHCYAVADSTGVQPMTISRPGLLEKQLERKCVRRYETLEALAAGEKINLEGLKKSIAEWNHAVETKKDDHFGRYVNPHAKTMGKAPWYVSEMVPKVHHCMGGINTDMQGHALDIVNDKPIPGLYAAGEATGGVHGAVRLGSCAVTDCIVYGRIAGIEAAKEKAWC